MHPNKKPAASARRVSRENLLRYRDTSAEDRIIWLEEAFRLMVTAKRVPQNKHTPDKNQD